MRHSRFRAVALVVAALALGVESSPLVAQVRTCSCSSTEPFASCEITTLPYDGQRPVTAAVVSVVEAQVSSTYLYVVDRDDGFVYRYVFTVDALNLSSCPTSPTCFSAPFGSLPTPSGLAYSDDDGALYWAIDGELVRTVPALDSPEFSSTNAEFVSQVDLAELANLLDLPVVGELGGITFHRARGTFWGIDVVNDVFFEFGLDGKPAVEGTRIVHFNNSERRALGRGAEGDAITYLEVDGVSYFDVAVGRGADGKPTRVERVYAQDTTVGELAVSIGDPVGVYYNASDFMIEDDTVVSGLANWSGACALIPDSTMEVLIEASENGGPSHIHVVSTDAPDTFGLGAYSCSSSGNNVTIEWTAPRGFATMHVVRTDLINGDSRQVLAIDDGSAMIGAGSFEDRNVADGAYEYVATVTALDGQGTESTMPDRRCVTNVGRGSVAAFTTITPTSPADVLPFAITYLGSSDRILVVDFRTGSGHLFDFDLEYLESFPGPFHSSNTLFAGNSTGVAWDPDTDEIIWVQDRGNGANWVQRTNLIEDEFGTRVEFIGNPALVRSPPDVIRPALGDIDYDAAGRQVWGVDRTNGVAYSFRTDGSLTGESFTKQLPNPRKNGISGGGLAVVSSASDSLLLDWIVNDEGENYGNQLDEISYGRALEDDGGSDTIFTPGQRGFSIDLATSTGALALGGMTTVEKGEERFTFIVAWESGQLFKLDMAEGIQGKEFIRGDANADGDLDVADASFVLAYLFKGGVAPSCADAADIDDDENIAISDAIVLFRYLFMSGPAPAEPFEACGRDFDPPLTCAVQVCD